MKKRVLFYAISKPTLSGGQTMILNILKNIDRENFDVELVMQYECPLSIQAEKMGIIVNYIPVPIQKELSGKNNLSKFISKVIKFFQYIYSSVKKYSFIKSRNYNIVWCENINALLLNIILKFTKVKLVYNMWSTINSNIGIKIISYISDHIVVEAAFQKKLFSKKYSKKVSVINTQIENQLFLEDKMTRQEAREFLKLPQNKLIVGFLGGCRYSKGFDLIFESIYNLVKVFGFKEVILLVGGKTDKDDLLNSPDLEKKLNAIKDNVIIRNWIDDKGAFYKSLDIFVSTSRSEGLPGAIREAMGFGLPIVATDVGGTSEALNGNGYLVPYTESREMTKKCTEYLIEVINNMEVSSLVGKKAKERAFEKFIGNKWIKELEEVFKYI